MSFSNVLSFWNRYEKFVTLKDFETTNKNLPQTNNNDNENVN